jgi:2-iminoacetate synthase ThiH
VESLKDRTVPVEGEDFYREGAYVVFTARYHLRRGYCCESGCRHCPYRGKPEDASGVGEGDGVEE